MKLAFTTLGCLEWDIETIITKAKEYDFDGVDFRGYNGEINIYKMPEFSSQLNKTVLMFNEAGLDVPCLSTSARLMPAKQETLENQLDEVDRYADICTAFGASMMRIFGGHFGDRSEEDAIMAGTDNLNELINKVSDRDVKVMVETHDDWITADPLKKLMEAVDSQKAGILWDVHHPYRLAGEPPELTWNKLHKWVGYTHVKDSRLDKTNKRGYQLCLTGEGDIPLKEIISLMKNGGYEGYLTLEWERKWHPEIEAPDIAFPRYVSVIREILEQD